MTDADATLRAAVKQLHQQVRDVKETVDQVPPDGRGFGEPRPVALDEPLLKWVFDVAGKVAGAVDSSGVPADKDVPCVLVETPAGVDPNTADAKDLVAQVCASFTAGPRDISVQLCAAIIITRPKPGGGGGDD